MATLDDHIAQSLRDSERSGELRSAPSYGKPLHHGDGWDETPEEFRLPFKILKDAGVVPAEVELMQQLGKLRQTLAATTDAEQRRVLQQRISELQQTIALRLEKLRVSGSL
ncbi:DUF1992 domain-containing protein [Aquincola sp. S2]|uniref:DUF1992 domain-containing protein n=1 Tax=Pseudaquabacterium terrae TaxID=2732868 RepID=A0ABX2ELE1_9BURK|nr:DUF1992 domain-containing protein [Aquabacterium terrae]NRF69495.1 DUF1992 domain-containing protein [Aquabacterium terrae]